MQKLPQPVKLWYLGPLLPPRAPPGGPLPPVQPDRRRGDRLRLAARRRRADHAARRAAARASGSPACGCGSAASARRRRAPPTARSCAAYLREHEAELAEDVRERIDENPLRAFDSKDEGTRAVMAEAPTMLDRLDGDDAEHFAAVRRLLDQAGVAYELDGTLVRGLDYYTRTVFEFECERLGAQSRGRRRRSLRRPDRGARRAADPGVRLGGRRRAHPAGARRADETRAAATSSSPPPTASASARWRSCTELRARGPARRARPRRPRRSRAR